MPITEIQESIPGMLIRGGTSKGLFVQRDVLPDDPDRRDAMILEMFGSPDPLQVDGIGGSYSHTSKIMLVSPSDDPDIDLAYTFGQVAVNQPVVDYSGNCGNLTSAIGGYGILSGMVSASGSSETLRLYNTNTDTVVEQTIPIVSGEPAIRGEYEIDGVPRSGARIDSRFLSPAGGASGALFPTGNERETITVANTTYTVSIVDVANPCVFVYSGDLGLDGVELPDEIKNRPSLLSTLEEIRSEACARIGLVTDPADATSESPGVPYVTVVSEPQTYESSLEETVRADSIDVTARLMSNQHPHHAIAMTGAMCLASAVRLPGTVPNEYATAGSGSVSIGHPKGQIQVGVDVDTTNDPPSVSSVTVGRTMRLLMTGDVYYRGAAQQSTEEKEPVTTKQ